ncbi:hypothetical protein ACWKWK_15585 [Pseudoxanthomonas beigongshangi]
MANRNCTGSHLARAFLRLNKVSKRVLRQTQANIRRVNAWLAEDDDRNLILCVTAISVLAGFLALAAAIADPLHPLSLTLAEVSNGR